MKLINIGVLIRPACNNNSWYHRDIIETALVKSMRRLSLSLKNNNVYICKSISKHRVNLICRRVLYFALNHTNKLCNSWNAVWNPWVQSLFLHSQQWPPCSPCMHGPLTRYVKFRVAHAPGMPGTFSPPSRFQGKPLLSDPGMHHGKCVTHVPWCMSGSLSRGDRENVPDIPAHAQPVIIRSWQEAYGQNGKGKGENGITQLPNHKQIRA